MALRFIAALFGMSLLLAVPVANAQVLPDPANPLRVENGGTQANDPASALRRLGGTPRLQIVGTRTKSPYGTPSTSGQAGHTFRTQHYLPYGARNIRLLYPGFVTSFGVSEAAIAPASYYATTCAVGAGGTGYVAGDVATVTTATNSAAPTIRVDAVSTGAATYCSVIDPGLLNAYPATGLATVKVTGAGDDALTVTLGVQPIAIGFHIGLEQAWGTQSAYSQTNPSGVIKLQAGGFTQLGRSANIYAPSGGWVLTDAPTQGLPLAAGTTIGIRADSNGFGCARELNLVTGTEYGAISSFTNFNAGLAWNSTYATTGGAACGPMAILGELDEPKPSFLAIGDSILASTSASIDAHGNVGWFERAIDRQQPWANWSRSGDTVSDWLQEYDLQRMQALVKLVRPSHVVEELGVNDLSSGSTSYATFIQTKLSLWAMLKASGVGEIWLTTITPYVTCSPDCSIPENMTASAGTAAIQTYNANVRAGLFEQYTGTKTYIDVARQVENPDKLGTWKYPGYTADGIHPSPTIGVPVIANNVARMFSDVRMPQ